MNKENMKPFFPTADHVLHKNTGKLQCTIVQENTAIIVNKWSNVKDNWSYFSLNIDFTVTCTECIKVAQCTVV